MTIWNTVQVNAKKRANKQAIGEARSGGAVFWSYEKLLADSIAAAVFLSESSNGSIPLTISGLGTYNTAVFIIAASRLGYSLIIKKDAPKGFFIGDSFVAEAEIRPRLTGILSRGEPFSLPQSSGEALFTFPVEDNLVTYSESSALFSAEAFSEGCALSSCDRLMYLVAENSPEGLFCCIIAPLIKGATSVKCDEPRDLLRHLKLVSPTKLFCSAKIAGALLLKLLSIKKLPRRALEDSHNSDTFKNLSDPTWVIVRRLMQPRITYILGGKLKTIITSKPMSPGRSRAFFAFGIFTIGAYSENGLVSALFHYGGDKPEVWRLPSGCRADVCHVQSNGIGQILLFSPAVREGNDCGATYIPLEKHFDEDDTALVSRLSGFILRDGSVFVTKIKSFGATC